MTEATTKQRTCCGMHGGLCDLADGPADLCCNECPLLAGHIEIVGYTRPSAPAEQEALPDDVYDAAVRALLQCPDVPAHAHVTMASLHRMVGEVAPVSAVRAAFLAVYAAGVERGHKRGHKAGFDDAEALTDDAIEERVGLELDALLARLSTADGMRTLGDLIDRHPHLEALLSTIPYVRRRELEALAETLGEMLGVENAC